MSTDQVQSAQEQGKAGELQELLKITNKIDLVWRVRAVLEARVRGALHTALSTVIDVDNATAAAFAHFTSRTVRAVDGAVDTITKAADRERRHTPDTLIDQKTVEQAIQKAIEDIRMAAKATTGSPVDAALQEVQRAFNRGLPLSRLLDEEFLEETESLPVPKERTLNDPTAFVKEKEVKPELQFIFNSPGGNSRKLSVQRACEILSEARLSGQKDIDWKPVDEAILIHEERSSDSQATGFFRRFFRKEETKKVGPDYRLEAKNFIEIFAAMLEEWHRLCGVGIDREMGKIQEGTGKYLMSAEYYDDDTKEMKTEKVSPERAKRWHTLLHKFAKFSKKQLLIKVRIKLNEICAQQDKQSVDFRKMIDDLYQISFNCLYAVSREEFTKQRLEIPFDVFSDLLVDPLKGAFNIVHQKVEDLYSQATFPQLPFDNTSPNIAPKKAEMIGNHTGEKNPLIDAKIMNDWWQELCAQTLGGLDVRAVAMDGSVAVQEVRKELRLKLGVEQAGQQNLLSALPAGINNVQALYDARDVLRERANAIPAEMVVQGISFPLPAEIGTYLHEQIDAMTTSVRIEAKWEKPKTIKAKKLLDRLRHHAVGNGAQRALNSLPLTVRDNYARFGALLDLDDSAEIGNMHGIHHFFKGNKSLFVYLRTQLPSEYQEMVHGLEREFLRIAAELEQEIREHYDLSETPPCAEPFLWKSVFSQIAMLIEKQDVRPPALDSRLAQVLATVPQSKEQIDLFSKSVDTFVTELPPIATQETLEELRGVIAQMSADYRTFLGILNAPTLSALDIAAHEAFENRANAEMMAAASAGLEASAIQPIESPSEMLSREELLMSLEACFLAVRASFAQKTPAITVDDGWFAEAQKKLLKDLDRYCPAILFHTNFSSIVAILEMKWQLLRRGSGPNDSDRIFCDALHSVFSQALEEMAVRMQTPFQWQASDAQKALPDPATTLTLPALLPIAQKMCDRFSTLLTAQAIDPLLQINGKKFTEHLEQLFYAFFARCPAVIYSIDDLLPIFGDYSDSIQKQIKGNPLVPEPQVRLFYEKLLEEFAAFMREVRTAYHARKGTAAVPQRTAADEWLEHEQRKNWYISKGRFCRIIDETAGSYLIQEKKKLAETIGLDVITHIGTRLTNSYNLNFPVTVNYENLQKIRAAHAAEFSAMRSEYTDPDILSYLDLDEETWDYACFCIRREMESEAKVHPHGPSLPKGRIDEIFEEKRLIAMPTNPLDAFDGTPLSEQIDCVHGAFETYLVTTGKRHVPADIRSFACMRHLQSRAQMALERLKRGLIALNIDVGPEYVERYKKLLTETYEAFEQELRAKGVPEDADVPLPVDLQGLEDKKTVLWMDDIVHEILQAVLVARNELFRTRYPERTGETVTAVKRRQREQQRRDIVAFCDQFIKWVIEGAPHGSCPDAMLRPTEIDVYKYEVSTYIETMPGRKSKDIKMSPKDLESASVFLKDNVVLAIHRLKLRLNPQDPDTIGKILKKDEVKRRLLEASDEIDRKTGLPNKKFADALEEIIDKSRLDADIQSIRSLDAIIHWLNGSFAGRGIMRLEPKARQELRAFADLNRDIFERLFQSFLYEIDPTKQRGTIKFFEDQPPFEYSTDGESVERNDLIIALEKSIADLPIDIYIPSVDPDEQPRCFLGELRVQVAEYIRRSCPQRICTTGPIHGVACFISEAFASIHSWQPTALSFSCTPDELKFEIEKRFTDVLQAMNKKLHGANVDIDLVATALDAEAEQVDASLRLSPKLRGIFDTESRGASSDGGKNEQDNKVEAKALSLPVPSHILTGRLSNEWEGSLEPAWWNEQVRAAVNDIRNQQSSGDAKGKAMKQLTPFRHACARVATAVGTVDTPEKFKRLLEGIGGAAKAIGDAALVEQVITHLHRLRGEVEKTHVPNELGEVLATHFGIGTEQTESFLIRYGEQLIARECAKVLMADPATDEAGILHQRAKIEEVYQRASSAWAQAIAAEPPTLDGLRRAASKITEMVNMDTLPDNLRDQLQKALHHDFPAAVQKPALDVLADHPPADETGAEIFSQAADRRAEIARKTQDPTKRSQEVNEGRSLARDITDSLRWYGQQISTLLQSIDNPATPAALRSQYLQQLRDIQNALGGRGLGYLFTPPHGDLDS